MASLHGGTWGLWSCGSGIFSFLVVTCRIFVFISCGIWVLVSWSGSPVLGAHSLSQWTTRRVSEWLFSSSQYFLCRFDVLIIGFPVFLKHCSLCFHDTIISYLFLMGHTLVSFNESTFAWLFLDDIIHSHSFKHWLCFRKRDLFQGPRVGSCLTLRSELSEETCAEKARDFIGKGYLGKEQQSKGTQENCSVMWLVVSGFMVIGLPSRLSLANHSDSGSFLVLFSLFI